MDDPDMCEEAVEKGWIDGVTLARGSLVDSQYPNKVAAGKLEEIRPCMRCTNCIDSVLAGDGPRCSANPAAMRGIADLNKWYQNEMKLRNVKVHMNTSMDAESIKAKNPDVVILAVGSDHFVPPIPGHDHEKSVVCYDALLGKVKLGEKIVVIGGGFTGTELAYALAGYEKKDVTIVEALPEILSSGPKLQVSVKMMLTELIDRENVKVMTGNKIAAVTDEGAVIENMQTGEQQTLPADNVIFAIGLRPKKSMYADLLGCKMDVYEIGDGKKVANIRIATSEAYEIARKL